MTGWLVVGTVAAVYDAYALRTGRDTLSSAAGRHPFIGGGALVGLSLHFYAHKLRQKVKP